MAVDVHARAVGTMTGTRTSAEAQSYLPAVLSRRQGAHFGAVDLRYETLPDGRCLYTYAVDWEELGGEQRSDPGSDLSEMMRHDRLETLRGREQTEEGRRCDGPCGLRLPVSALTVLGLCEHAVCRACLEGSGCVGVGALGCPNRRCFLLDVAALCPDRRERRQRIRALLAAQSPVSLETCSRRSASLVRHRVGVVVAVLRTGRGDGAQFLQKNFFEHDSRSSLADALEAAVHELPELQGLNLDGRCFLGPMTMMQLLDRATWHPVNRVNRRTPLHEIENADMRVMIVIDLHGYHC